MNDKTTNNSILAVLAQEYRDAASGLNFNNPFELLIATILSAQTTDRQVNNITPALFARYPTPAELANADLQDVEGLIKSCGFYITKARNIIAASRMLMEDYSGSVPRNMDELIRLPGVGRKTANVVMANAFGKDAIAVDTHVLRVGNRLGLSDSGDPYKAELELMRSIPQNQWSDAHHWLIWHGRRVCSARRPKCGECKISPWCRYYHSGEKESV